MAKTPLENRLKSAILYQTLKENMRFSKKFFIGFVAVFAGILSAFDKISDYRTWSIVIFWISMLSAIGGTVLMFRGIEEHRNGNNGDVNQEVGDT